MGGPKNIKLDRFYCSCIWMEPLEEDVSGARSLVYVKYSVD